MKNIHIIKLGGLLAVICFLFLPVAGCGPMDISGVDLIKMDDISIGVKILAILAMIFALAIVFLKKKTQMFFCAIGGVISLVIAYLVAKGNMNSESDFGMSDAIELKSGSYLSIIGLIIAAVVSRIKKELFENEPKKDDGSN